MRKGFNMRLKMSSVALEDGLSFSMPTFIKIFATALNVMEAIRTII
jgi:hypothetical protein